MKYLSEVYGRTHWILTSVESWTLWFIVSEILVTIIAIVRDGGSKHKNQITYYFILFIIGSFVLKIILWVLLPSPELFRLMINAI